MTNANAKYQLKLNETTALTGGAQYQLFALPITVETTQADIAPIENFHKQAASAMSMTDGVYNVDSLPPSTLQNSPNFTPNDPLIGTQWHFGFLGDIQKIWDEYTGDTVDVGVYDDGLQYTHQDLDGNYNAALQVTVSGNIIDPDPTATSDPHGTSVAGLIAAEGNNSEGVVGVAFEAGLTGVTIFSGPADINANFAGFLEAADQLDNFDVVNHSWGSSPSFNPAFRPGDVSVETKYLNALAAGRGGLGTVQVQAAGNNGANADGDWLNGTRATITIGAYDDDGDASFYSNHGASLHVSAPSSGSSSAGNLGQGTTDLLGGAGYSSTDYTTGFGGTSGATPIVTGVIALMMDANANLGWRDIQDILSVSATETGSGIGGALGPDEEHPWYYTGSGDWNGGGRHFSEDYGFGAVNAFNAVRMAEVWSLFDTAHTSANEDSFFNSYNASSLAIPDLGSIDFTFTVPASTDFSLDFVELTLDITHTFLPDLVIDITSPGGTTSRIFTNDGNSTLADSGWEWTFGINSLRGEMAAGDWTLSIADTAGADIGVLDRVDILGYGRDATSTGVNLANNTYHYTDEVFNALADEPARMTLNDSGGTDWLNLSAVSQNLVMDMRQGLTSTLGGSNFLTIGVGTDIENAVLGDGDDSLTGNAMDNIIYGMRGNDNIDSDAGNDSVYGGAGNDTLKGSLGNDILDGGDGIDSINHFFSNAGVTVNLDTGASSGGFAAGDTISNFENIFGSAFNDNLTGNAGVNDINGSDGNDKLNGMGGDDFLFGGLGDDKLTGGAGADHM
ncbi:MAG: S8 family serine peptidase, partial [bacterium]